MNEEEIIKECEEIIKDLNNHKDKDFIGRLYYKNRPVEDLLQGILDLYQKEKEKNKELSEKVTQNICNRVEAEVLEEYRLKVQNSISKDKIREKIEYLEKEIEEKQENCLDFTLIHEHEIDTNGIIEVLQELLEERN